MKRGTVKPITAGLGLARAVLLSGCAGLGTDRPAEEVVRERAQAWADALLDDDLKAAYQYTSPGYRSYATAGTYHARVAGAGRWKKAEVRQVTCVEKACEVTFTLEYRSPKAGADVRRLRQYRWINLKGQWWLYVSA